MSTPRFEIFEGKNNEFFFRLKAKNGKILLQSEGYTQRNGAYVGMDSVCSLAKFDSGKFELRETVRRHEVADKYKSLFAGIYFVAIAQNGEIIGRSETYTSKAGAKKGIESVRRCAPIAEIVDLTKD